MRPWTPADRVETRVRKRRPLTVSADVVRTVAANLALQEEAGRLRDAKTRAGFMVLASCLMRPSQLKRIEPPQLDLTRGILWVDAGKDGEPMALPLNGEQRAAWQLFVREAA